MKTILKHLVFTFLFLPFFGAMAQEGVIVYEVKVNMHRNVPKEREGMKAMIPEFSTSKQALYFNANASLYKRMVDEEEEATQMSAGGGGMRIHMRNMSGELFLQPADFKRVSLRDFNGKKYLIQDSLAVLPWKFGSETKTILGHTCKLATYYDERRKLNVVAWYSEKLRPFLGPDSFGSLPGGVLEIDVNDGERVIKAVQLDLRALKKNELAEPTKGEKISEKDFQAMLTEQMEQMRRNGGMIIRN